MTKGLSGECRGVILSYGNVNNRLPRVTIEFGRQALVI